MLPSRLWVKSPPRILQICNVHPKPNFASVLSLQPVVSVLQVDFQKVRKWHQNNLQLLVFKLSCTLHILKYQRPYFHFCCTTSSLGDKVAEIANIGKCMWYCVLMFLLLHKPTLNKVFFHSSILMGYFGIKHRAKQVKSIFNILCFH